MSGPGAAGVEAAAEVGAALLAWVGPMTVATGVILVGVLVADRLLERRVAASVRLLLYGAVLARLALPAGWQSPLGVLGFGGERAALVSGRVSDAPDLALSSAPAAVLSADILSKDSGPVEFGSVWQEVASPRLGLEGWALVVYIFGVLVLLGRWGQARMVLRRRLRSASPLGGTADAASADPTWVGRRVPVLRHTSLGPLVAGLLRPRIVVPGALVDDPDHEPLRWVLRHEAAHVERRDPLLGAFVQLACILGWPLLPLWIAARRVRTLMEVACDERALRGANRVARRRYGQVLLALAGVETGTALTPSLSFGSPLRGRLRALAAARRWPVAVQALVVAAVGTLAVACAGDGDLDEGDGGAAGDAGGGDSADGMADATEVGTNAQAGSTSVGGARAGLRLAPPAGTRFGVREATGNLGLRLTPGRLGDPSAAPSVDEGLAPNADSVASSRNGDQPIARKRTDPILSITARGAFYLFDREVSADDLETELREALQAHGSETLLIRGDKKAMLGQAVDVMSVAKRAGARTIALLTAPPSGTKVEVTVTKDGDVWVGNERARGDVETRLRAQLAAAGTDMVAYRLDPALPRADVVRLFEVAKRAGARRHELINDGLVTPPAEAAAAPRKDPILTVTADGSLYLGKRKVTPENLREELRKELAASGTDTVLIRGDKQVMLHRAVDLRKIIEQAGGRNTAFLTDSASRGELRPGANEAAGTDAANQARLAAPHDGDLDPGPVSREVQARWAAVRECYERGLQHTPSSPTRVELRWSIEADGTTSNVRVIENRLQNRLPDASVVDCIVGLVQRWRFPPLAGGPFEVAYPFVFDPSPRSNAETPRIFQKLSSPAALAAAAANRAAQDACYSQALKRNPSARGTVRIRVTTAPDGSPSTTIVRNDTADAAFASCLAELFQRRPPVTKGGASGDYVFNFKFDPSQRTAPQPLASEVSESRPPFRLYSSRPTRYLFTPEALASRDPAMHVRSVANSSGALDPSLVTREVRSRMAAVKACYERTLIRTPPARGKITLRWIIEPNGTVSSPQVVENTLPDTSVAECVAGLVKRWRFPSPEGGAVEVVFPFVLHSAAP